MELKTGRGGVEIAASCWWMRGVAQRLYGIGRREKENGVRDWGAEESERLAMS